MTPQVAVELHLQAEHRLFDGPPPPASAVTDVIAHPHPGVASVSGAAGTTAARATTRATDNRTHTYASGPAAPPLRLHVAHLAVHPERFPWVCSWSYRYRRALGDSRVVAFRRALSCAHSHREVTHAR